MELTWLEILGLIGITLVVSAGKVFNGLREYLKDFEHPWNPMHWAGDIISCSMCSGVWVGFGWGLMTGETFFGAVLMGGFISVASFAANEILGLLGITTLRLSRGVTYGSAGGGRGGGASSLADARSRARTKVVHQGEDISEDEADALADSDNERADAMLVPPDEAA